VTTEARARPAPAALSLRPFTSAHVSLERWGRAVDALPLVQASGEVVRVSGPVVQARLPSVRVGEMCRIGPLAHSGAFLGCEVIGFQEHLAMLSPFGGTTGIGPGTPVQPLGRPHGIRVGAHMLGQLLDGFGKPMVGTLDDDPASVEVEVRGSGPSVSRRLQVDEALPTGVRVIDGMLTFGKGQRMGVFAPPGCGKTTLMNSIGMAAQTDVVVFALIGERGRELAEMAMLLDHPHMKERAVIVGATSDRSAGERMRAAYTATAIAEGLRAQGRSVLLLVDSLTRFARAVRETSIAAGEPVGRSGLPASVYTELPRLIERAGNTREGSISALYMVLAEGAVKDDPIAEEVRSLVDGHIVLSRSLSEKGIFPAINVLESLSRLMPDITESGHMASARRIRRLMARYEEMELLLRLGEIKPGVDRETDLAIEANAEILEFLQQGLGKPSSLDEARDGLETIARRYAA
jgi:ATP synthase in type III secretion protein N